MNNQNRFKKKKKYPKRAKPPQGLRGWGGGGTSPAPGGHRALPRRGISASPAGTVRPGYSCSSPLPATGKRNRRGERGNCRGFFLSFAFFFFFFSLSLSWFCFCFVFGFVFFNWEKPFSVVAFAARRLSRFSQPRPGRCSLHSSAPSLINSRATRIYYYYY